MPSPFAHLVTGIALGRGFCAPSDEPRLARAWLGLALVMSMAPDGDAVLGAMLGDMAGWHNQATHAPVMLPLAALAAGALWRTMGGRGFLRAAALGMAAYGAHLAMDFFTVSRGAMLLWPWTDTRFRPPFPLFYGLRWSDGFFSPRHLITLGSEAITLGVLVMIGGLWNRMRARRRAHQDGGTP